MKAKTSELVIRIEEKYSTHMPMLLKYVQMTDGPVAELGAGVFSTPLLHWLCEDRRLVSYEDRRAWEGFLNSFASENHSAVFVDSWDEVDTTGHWSVVLIDHDPKPADLNLLGKKYWENCYERRKHDALRFKDIADYIIIHDTELDAFDEDFFKNFKYVYRWEKKRPYTSVVSNLKEVP